MTPITKGCETPEYRRMTPAPAPCPEIPKPDALITITVAEYHCLTKAATMLEMIISAQMHDRHAVVEAAQKIMQDMLQLAEAGAEE